MSHKGNIRKDNSLLIELKNITRSFGYGEAESFALNDFNLEVKPGEFIMIMGPSGCGKTTLLNIIGLLDFPTSGSYYLDSERTTVFSKSRQAHIRAKKIGFIFQDFNLIPKMTILENVSLPLVYAGVPKTKRLIKSSEMLSYLNMQKREYYYPYQLSGGQKQRVAIARALVSAPEIILADEPTGNLDSHNAHLVMEELRRIHSKGNTIIMVTHNPALTKYATRVLHMIDGSIDRDFKFVADHNLPERIDIHFNPKTAKSETTPVSSCSEEIPVTNKSEIPRIIKSETPRIVKPETPRITSESKPTSMRPKITRAPEPSANPFEPKFIPNTPEKPTEKSVEKPLSYNLGTVSELPTSSKKPVSTPVKEYFPPVKSKTEETKPETPKKEAEEVEPVSQIATITPIKRNKSNSALKFNLNFNKKSKSHTKKSTKKKGHK